MELAPKLSARVAVMHENNVLLLQRHPDSNNLGGYWELSGGGINPGEHPVVAGHRETFEETGQDVDMLTLAAYILPDRLITSGSHASKYIRTFGFVGLTSSDTVVLSPEHSDYRWINAQKIMKMGRLTPGTKSVIEGLGGVLGIEK